MNGQIKRILAAGYKKVNIEQEQRMEKNIFTAPSSFLR
jgi:ribosome-associated protein YbcJ (S4-like RNA binding protein)